jgi:hypothetical protein
LLKNDMFVAILLKKITDSQSCLSSAYNYRIQYGHNINSFCG